MSICKKCKNYELELDDMQERCIAGRDMALADEDCENFRFSDAERLKRYRTSGLQAGRYRKEYYVTVHEHAILRKTLNKLRAKS